VNPLQDRHDPGHAVAGSTEFSLRKPHELVRRAIAARQEKRKYRIGKVRP
jgi:hypothetical protein